MQDLKVNIGGPRDQAKQSISFNVRYGGSKPASVDKSQVAELVQQLRAELSKANISAEDTKRAERNLKAIEEETSSSQPALKEVEGALGSIGRILESAKSLTPTVVTVFRTLASVFGFNI